MSGGDLPRSSGHPFYERLNGLLESRGFDEFVESECSEFYAERMGRPSLRPGRYFRMLLLGYFEGLDSERGIAWRAQDSLSIRRFLDLGVTESAPDHSTISRTRRLIAVETHAKVFSWVLGVLADSGLGRGRRWGWTRRLWRRTRRCEASCVVTRARSTRSSFGAWRRPRVWRRRRRRSWRASTASGRRSCPTRSGRIRTIRMQR